MWSPWFSCEGVLAFCVSSVHRSCIRINLWVSPGLSPFVLTVKKREKKVFFRCMKLELFSFYPDKVWKIHQTSHVVPFLWRRNKCLYLPGLFFFWFFIFFLNHTLNLWQILVRVFHSRRKWKEPARLKQKKKRPLRKRQKVRIIIPLFLLNHRVQEN